MKLNIETKGFKETVQKLKDISANRLPKVVAISLTKVIKRYQVATIAGLSVYFDRPTPWILKSTYIKPATPVSLSASVEFKDATAMASQKGLSASEIVYPHIFGGKRKVKRFEEALRRYRRLSPTGYVMPAKGYPRNKYGNISTGVIVKALTAARALEGMSQAQFYGITGGYKLRKGTEDYFIGSPGEKRQGIWQRYGSKKSKIKPVFIFTQKTPQYQKRLPFLSLAQTVLPKWFREEFEKVAQETIQYHLKK